MKFEPSITLDGVLALLGFSVAIIVFLTERMIERRNQRKATYFDLEMAANELFRFMAQNPDLCLMLEDDRKLPKKGTIDSARLQSCMYQIITLFEIAIRFRRQGIMPSEIFATWVAWMGDYALGRNFGKIWPGLSASYHADCTDIFDKGTDIAKRNKYRNEKKSRTEFYQYVAEYFDDPGIVEFTKTGMYPE